MCRAIAWRIGDSGSRRRAARRRRPSWPLRRARARRRLVGPVRRLGVQRPLGLRPAAAPSASMCASTSVLRTRPPMPVPSTCVEVDRRARRRSAGRPGSGSRSGRLHRSLGAPAGSSGLRRGGLARPRRGGPRPARRRGVDLGDRRRRRPRSRRPRRGSARACRRPGDGISTSTLSVVTSQIVSSASTQSPGRLSHSTIVPSATETPICGIITSTCASVREELTARLLHVVELRQDRLLERRAERDRHVGRGQPPDRRVEVLEGIARRRSPRPPRRPRTTASPRARPAPCRLARARQDRLGVERAQRAQVDHLDLLAELLGGLEREVDGRAVGDHASSRPAPRRARPAPRRAATTCSPSGTSPRTLR